MSDRVQRLSRLHGIRKIQGDVEESALRCLQDEATLLQQQTSALRQSAFECLFVSDRENADAEEWQLRVAERALHTHRLHRALLASDQLAGAVEEQRLRHQHAKCNEEQVKRLVDTARQVQVQDQARREQRTLDDLHACRHSRTTHPVPTIF